MARTVTFASTIRRMDILGVALVDAGLFCMLLGAICLCHPIRRIGITSRKRAAFLALGGLCAFIVGGHLPAQLTRVANPQTRLDQFTPVYQFHEFHTTRVNAPADSVYAAVKSVEPDEIFGFRTLTSIRRFGRRGGAPNILNPPAHEPILQTALRTGFVSLADDPGQEIVIGLVMSPLLMGWKPTPEEFLKLDRPLLVKATMNFRIDPIDATHCTLTTETRMYGTDPDALKLFAPYWRTIYPGSAFMRRMWLRAIRQRAESAAEQHTSRAPRPSFPRPHAYSDANRLATNGDSCTTARLRPERTRAHSYSDCAIITPTSTSNTAVTAASSRSLKMSCAFGPCDASWSP